MTTVLSSHLHKRSVLAVFLIDSEWQIAFCCGFVTLATHINNIQLSLAPPLPSIHSKLMFQKQF